MSKRRDRLNKIQDWKATQDPFPEAGKPTPAKVKPARKKRLRVGYSYLYKPPWGPSREPVRVYRWFARVAWRDQAFDHEVRIKEAAEKRMPDYPWFIQDLKKETR
jgi:hypothetical protein